MIVVVALLLLFSSIVVLSFSSSRKSTEREKATKQFATLVSLARTIAVNNNGIYQVAYYFPFREMWIDEVDENGVVIRPKIIAPKKLVESVDLIQVRVLPRNGVGDVYEKDTAKRALITFYPDASSDYAVVTFLHSSFDGTRDDQFDSIVVYSSTGIARTYLNRKKL